MTLDAKRDTLLILFFTILITPVILLIILAAFDRTIIFVPFNTKAVVYVLGGKNKVLGAGFHVLNKGREFYDIFPMSSQTSLVKVWVDIEDNYHNKRNTIVETEITWCFKDLNKSKHLTSLRETVQKQKRDFEKKIRSSLCSFDKEESMISKDNPVDKEKLSQKIKNDLNKDESIEVIEVKIASVEAHSNPDTPNC
jgi:hypothetical protein